MASSEPPADGMLLEWEAPEYIYYEKGADWYWWTGLCAIALLGLAVWQKSFLFGVLVLVGWFTVILYASRPPRDMHFAITDSGMLIGDRLYPWNELESFWIFQRHPLQREISLKSQHVLMPYIKIPLAEKMDAEKTREALMKFLQEIEQQESLIDNLAHLIGF